MKVFLSGGLGNQLFQWAFAHHLAFETQEVVEIVKLNTRISLQHAQIDISGLKFDCTHLVKGKKSLRVLDELTNPYQPTHKLILKLRWGNIHDSRAMPFLGPVDLQINGYSSFVGYYQNYMFVENLKDTLILELEKLLEKPNFRFSEEIPSSFQVMHIRQADTMSAKNLRRVGVLSRDYYKKILSCYCDLPTLVVTDDLMGAKHLLQGLEYERILSNLELDQFQTLNVLRQAKRVITANSTFSWWGGVLAKAHGAEVVIPHPFFVSQELDVSNNLNFPGFSVFESDFLV